MLVREADDAQVDFMPSNRASSCLLLDVSPALRGDLQRDVCLCGRSPSAVGMGV